MQTSRHMVFKTIGGFFLSINRLFKTFKTMTIDKFTVLKLFFFFKFYLKYHEMHAYLLSVLSFKRYKIDTIFNVLIAVCCLSTFVFDKLSFIVSSFHLNNYSILYVNVMHLIKWCVFQFFTESLYLYLFVIYVIY